MEKSLIEKQSIEGTMESVMMTRFKRGDRFNVVVKMIPSVNKDGKKVDTSKFINDDTHIVLYGSIDLTSYSDIEKIKEHNLVFQDGRGMMRSGFNYEQGTTNLYDGLYKEAPCSDPITWFKYKHCLIGKPKEVIIFEEVVWAPKI